MIKQLVFNIDPSILSGGFADRIGGMATLHKIAKCLSVDFKINFKIPFDFFDVFPGKEKESRFDCGLLETHNHIVKKYNLIDSNFEKNISLLCSDLISKSEIVALVSINNVKPLNWNLLLDDFSYAMYQQVDYDVIERFVLMNFGLAYLQPNYAVFNERFNAMLPKFINPIIGVQIRVGGANPNWEDPKFTTPNFDDLFNFLDRKSNDFDEIFLCSDDLRIKNELFIKLNEKYKVFSFESTPLHVDRSKNLSLDFITNSIGDHCLLRLCRAGIAIGGGGYGRTAAILAGVDYYRINN